MFRTDKLSQTAGWGYPKAYVVKAKQTSLLFCYSRKTYAQSIAFPFPKKQGLLFGVPESRKTLRGKGANERQV